MSDRSTIKLDNEVMDVLGVPRRSVAMLSNHCAMGTLFSRASHKWDSLYAKRAWVHHYMGVGLESGEMSETRENLAALEKDYEECAMKTEDLPYYY